jgi:hypothetical protein
VAVSVGVGIDISVNMGVEVSVSAAWHIHGAVMEYLVGYGIRIADRYLAVFYSLGS